MTTKLCVACIDLFHGCDVKAWASDMCCQAPPPPEEKRPDDCPSVDTPCSSYADCGGDACLMACDKNSVVMGKCQFKDQTAPIYCNSSTGKCD